MTLLDKIFAIYPDLVAPLDPVGPIQLRDDCDGRGPYIDVWEHPTLPRPTDEQLAALH